jgi:hypothetical protein
MRWGLCPHTPGIYRFGARMTGGGGLLPPRHSGPESASGRIPALPYPPPRRSNYTMNGHGSATKNILRYG